MNEKNTPASSPAPAPRRTAAPSQNRRRAVYGLNITIAVLAAVALTIFANWFVHWSYVRIGPEAKRFVRYDLTATRRYSLSPQTRKVLADTRESVDIVTMFRLDGPQLQRIRDLIDEYGLYGRQVTVRHLNPTRDLTQREQFFKEIAGRFDTELRPLREALEQATATLERTGQSLQALAAPLNTALRDTGLPEGANRQFLRQAASAFERYAEQLAELRPQLAEQLDEALPAYGSLRSQVEETLSTLDSGLLGPAATQIERLTTAPDVPAAVQNELIRAAAQLKNDQEPIRATLDRLRAVDVPAVYDEIRATIASTESVILAGERGVRVIPIGEMYRPVPAEQAEQGGIPEDAFIGEEKLTGALASLRMGKAPLVVLVSGGAGSPIGDPRGYRHVADRLRSASFIVKEWSPEPTPTQFGQPMPPQPAPEPEDGQKAIWVVLPTMPQQPMNPMMMAGDSRGEVAQLLADRIDAGDSVLFLTAPDPMAHFGAPNPLADLYAEFGLQPELDKAVVRELQLPNGQTRASGNFDLNQWPEGFSVTAALAGQRGLIYEAYPIRTDESAQITYHPLVRLQANRMWTTQNMGNPQALQSAKFDEATALSEAIVGIAAERADGRRAALFTDPVWASDQITTYGAHPLFGQGPNLLSIPGAVALFPGNAELFINTAYWLAGMDELIAASARTQDIRRVDPISDRTRTGLYLLLYLGLPGSIFAAGVGVWLIRRRG